MLEIRNIQDIKGIGTKMVQKIVESYGSYEKLIENINDYNIDKLMKIPGLSQEKAIKIAQYILNGNENEFLKTDQTKLLYNDIIKRILEFTNTDYARNRVLLLNPTTDYNKIEETEKLIFRTQEEIKNLDQELIQSLFLKLKPLNKKIKPKFDDTYAIICEDYSDYLSLLEKKFNSYCNIHAIEDNVDLEQYEFIIYLYNECNIDPGDSNNIIMIRNTSEDYEILPRTIIEYYKQNKETFHTVMKIREVLNWDTCIKETIDILDSLEKSNFELNNIEEITEEIKNETNLTIKEKIKHIDLKGEEVLELLDHKNMPPKIMSIFEETLYEAKQKLQEQTGLTFDPFIIKYPLELDKDELKRVKTLELTNKHIKEYEQELDACSILEKNKEIIEKEILETIHYDYPFSLARFSNYYNLTIPEIKDYYLLKDTVHLSIVQQEKITNSPIQKIKYSIQKDNTILLTGANSGGKTTLLETIGQHCIMGHMGLGVCSKKAIISKTNEIYYFTKKHSLNAGAFETFLETFIPVTIGAKNKLILIDELESITELEAAIKIITSFIEHLTDPNTFTIIVTHMAPEILKYSSIENIRVDGIEAEGLDENYNLIVNRSPKINYLAKSTPELILKRIYQKTEPHLQDIYKDILNKF